MRLWYYLNREQIIFKIAFWCVRISTYLLATSSSVSGEIWSDEDTFKSGFRRASINLDRTGDLSLFNYENSCSHRLVLPIIAWIIVIIDDRDDGRHRDDAYLKKIRYTNLMRFIFFLYLNRFESRSFLFIYVLES